MTSGSMSCTKFLRFQEKAEQRFGGGGIVAVPFQPIDYFALAADVPRSLGNAFLDLRQIGSYLKSVHYLPRIMLNHALSARVLKAVCV
jgi:hypothetical protein